MNFVRDFTSGKVPVPHKYNGNYLEHHLADLERKLIVARASGLASLVICKWEIEIHDEAALVKRWAGANIKIEPHDRDLVCVSWPNLGTAFVETFLSGGDPNARVGHNVDIMGELESQLLLARSAYGPSGTIEISVKYSAVKDAIEARWVGSGLRWEGADGMLTHIRWG